MNTKPTYSARMQELWSRVDMRGFCIGAAYWPLLLIYSVSGCVHREGLATRGTASMPEALLRAVALPLTAQVLPKAGIYSSKVT